jgi:hypothetical protein
MFSKIKQKLMDWYFKRKMKQTMQELEKADTDYMIDELQEGINDIENNEK